MSVSNWDFNRKGLRKVMEMLELVNAGELAEGDSFHQFAGILHENDSTILWQKRWQQR